MNRSYWWCPLLAVLLFAAVGVCGAQAQSLRAGSTFYVQPRVGLGGFYGDFEPEIGIEHHRRIEPVMLPRSLSFEAGYQFSPSFSAGLSFLRGDYPRAEPLGGDNTARYNGQLLVRYLWVPSWRLSPYVSLGLQAGTQNLRTVSYPPEAYGPVGAFGVDIVLSPRVSLFAEAQSNMMFPDNAFDGRRGDRGFDLVQFSGIGLRVTFDAAPDPLRLVALEAPDTLAVDEGAEFVVDLEGRNSDEAEIAWAFGDGSTGTSETARHAYIEPGVYEVGVNATRGRETVGEKRLVHVLAPPTIDSLWVLPEDPVSGQSLEFGAEVHGSGELDYSWQFGDGLSSDTTAPTHSYRSMGTYEVRLTVENAVGRARATKTLEVESPARFVVQVGAFKVDENAMTRAKNVRERLPARFSVQIVPSADESLNRVIVQPRVYDNAAVYIRDLIRVVVGVEDAFLTTLEDGADGTEIPIE